MCCESGQDSVRDRADSPVEIILVMNEDYASSALILGASPGSAGWRVSPQVPGPQRRHAPCIRGHVQGVGFRWALSEQARALGLLAGSANRIDGSVEALICGPMEAVTALADWAHCGPPGARVTAVEMHAAETAGPLAGSGASADDLAGTFRRWHKKKYSSASFRIPQTRSITKEKNHGRSRRQASPRISTPPPFSATTK